MATNPFDQFDNPFDIFDEDYAGPVHRAERPGLLEENWRKAKAGFGAGIDRVGEVFGELMPDLSSERTKRIEEDVARGLGYKDRADHQRAMQAQRIAQSERNFRSMDTTHPDTARGLQEIAEAEGPLDAVKAAVRNPRAVAATTSQSLGMIAPGMAAAAASGPAAPAAVGANSAAIEYQSTILDTMAEAGIDTGDASQVRRALDNPELMARAKERGTKRGLAIGAFDAATAGIAGRLVAGARGVPSAVARTGGELGAQAGGGMAGESVAQLATDGKVTQWGDVVMEGIAELPTTITEVPTNYGRAREAFRNREADAKLVQDDYRALAGDFDATITSLTRSAKRNAKVGGVANSQHLRGTAGDFVVPDAQKDAFKAEARARGYEVIDEGDHIHLELPSGKAGKTTLEGRRAQRAREVAAGTKAPGAAAVEDALDEARKNRGMSLDRDGETESPTTTPTAAAPTRDELLERANDPARSPTERREAKRSLQRAPEHKVSDRITALKDKLLDSVVAQSVDTPPISVPGNRAEQLDPVSTPPPAPTPQPPVSTANQPPDQSWRNPRNMQVPEDSSPVVDGSETVKRIMQEAGGDPAVAHDIAEGMMADPETTREMHRQIDQWAAPVAPQAPPAAEPVAQAPTEPAPPVAPPAQPAEPTGTWQVIRRMATPATRALENSLQRSPAMRQLLMGDSRQPIPADSIQEVELAPAEQRSLNLLGKVLGRKLVLFDVDTPNGIELSGLAVDSKHIFINVASVRREGVSLPAVIGHEFTHTLRTQGSKLLDDLIGYAGQRVNTSNSYAMKRIYAYANHYGNAGLRGAALADMITEELVADFMGDLIADETFWAELAEQDPSLFRRLIKRVIQFLTQIRDRAKQLGHPEAFRDAEAMRAKAVAIMREHLGRVESGAVAAEPNRVRGQNPAMPALSGDYRVDLVRDRATKMAHSYFERGDFMSAATEAANASATDMALPMDIETPEQQQFFRDASPHVKQGGKAAVFFHGKVSGKEATSFRPRAGAAVFMAEKSHFATPYAAAGYKKQLREGQVDVIVDGQSMQEQREQHTPGSAEHAFADIMVQAEGDVMKAFDLLPDYAYTINYYDDPKQLTYEDNDAVAERLGQLSVMLEDDANVVRVVPRKGFTGMHIVPLVTNVKKVWDFHNKTHVKLLVEELRDKFGSLAEFKKAMHMTHSFENWDHVARSLANPGSNWTLTEDLGADLPGLIRGMGFDAYTVSEEGHTNLAVFDPRAIKSAFGNVGSWGVRPPTAEEAASIGMTLEEALAAQQEGDIRLSLGNVMSQTFTNGLYTHENREALERWFHDEFRDLREVQKIIAQQHFGGSLPQGLDAHRYENLRHGAYQDARGRAEDRFVRPIAKILSKAGLDLDGFSDYLWWRHAPERDAYLRSHLDPAIAAGVAADALTGIDPADARANIAALDPATRRAYERAAKFIDGMRRFTLDRLVQTGQITRDHYNNVLAQYRYYVPFRGMPDGSDMLNGTGQGRGLNMNKNALGKRATGRKSKPSNIMEEMMRDMDLALIGEQKQRVLDAVVKLIAVHPDPDLWDVQPIKAERKWVNGVLTVVQTNGEAQNQITFMHRGIPVKIEIAHEGMRKALLNLQEPMPKWLRRVGRMTRWLSAVKTSFSPFFLLINPVRDAGLATMAVLAEHGMGTLRSVAKFYPHTWDALRADDEHLKVPPHSDPLVNKARQYAREASALGMKTGYTYVNDIREQQKKLRHLIDRHSKSKGMKDLLAGNFGTKDAALVARKAQQRVAHLFEVVNDMAENSTRLAVYAALRDQGWSPEDAAAYAKEVTVNFNRRGSASKIIGGFYMFFNAAMQGGVRMAKLMKNPKFAGMMGGIFASSYALAISQMFAAGDDDDGESNYDKAISDAQSQRSIGIYLGGGKSLAMPVPYGPNIFSYAGYRLAKLHYDLARGKNPSLGKAAGDIIGQGTMSMSPIDPGRGWSAFLPELARVPIQTAMNRNDFGGKINPKLMGTREEKMLPLVDKTDIKTGAPYRWAAAALNELSGGTKYRPGAVNVTGEQARYVAEQFGGGPLRLATESWELFENMLAGIDPEPSDVPLANVYFRGKGEDRHAASYYANDEDYDRSVAQWKKAVAEDDQEAIERILKHAPWVDGAEVSANTKEGRELQAGSVMEAKREIDGVISDLRKEQRAVLADKTLDWRERKRLSREIDLEIVQYQKDFNAAMNAGRQQ